MNFPVFSQLAGNFGFPETGSLETASSSEESANYQFLSGGAVIGDSGFRAVRTARRLRSQAASRTWEEEFVLELD